MSLCSLMKFLILDFESHKNIHIKGSFINHVDRNLDFFDPPSPLFNRAYVVIWTIDILPPPDCPHGLWMPPIDKLWHTLNRNNRQFYIQQLIFFMIDFRSGCKINGSWFLWLKIPKAWHSKRFIESIKFNFMRAD